MPSKRGRGNLSCPVVPAFAVIVFFNGLFTWRFIASFFHRFPVF